MADSDPTDPPPSPVQPSPWQRGKQIVRVAVERIRRVPYLASAAALLGLLILCVLTSRDAYAMISDTPESAQLQYKLALDQKAQNTFAYDFFVAHWNLGAVLLLPALVLAWIRCRGRAFALPLTLLTLALYVLWLFSDLHFNLHRAYHTVMGEVPAPHAYWAKLVIISVAIFSVPGVFLAYQASGTLDRYMVRSFAAPFLLCMLGIIAIMITMDLLNNANDFLKANFTLGQVGEFYLRQLPQLIVMIIDAAVLLAALYTVSRMSRFNEMVSMLGAGRSLVRILTPLFIIGLWTSLISLAMNYEWAPAAQNAKDAMLRNADKSEKRRRAERTSTYNVMYRNREDNRTWFLNVMPNSLTADSKIFFAAIFQDDGKGNLIKAWYACRAGWVPQHKEWRLFDAWVIDPKVAREQEKLGNYKLPHYERLPVDEPWRETPWSILSDKINPDYLSVQELESYLQTNADLSEKKLAKYSATLHSRFSLPFRSLLMVLIAAPLGVVTGRRGVMGAIAVAILLFILIFFLYTIFLKAGEAGYLTPMWGAWIINLIFAAVGLATLWFRNGNRQFTWNPIRWFRREACAPT